MIPSFLAIVIAFLLLSLRLEAFSLPGFVRQCSVKASISPSSLRWTHPPIHSENQMQYTPTSFPSYNTSLTSRIQKYMKRVKRVLVTLCFAVVFSKQMTSAASKVTAPRESVTSRVCEVRTTKQQKISKLSDISTVVVAAVMGTVLGKQIIVKKNTPDEDPEGSDDIIENNEIIATTNDSTNDAIMALNTLVVPRELDEFQMKRRVAADRRVRELLAANNAKPLANDDARVKTNLDRSSGLSPPAPMSGWAGYKNERWGGYLDSLNVRGSQDFEAVISTPVSINSYLDGLSKSPLGSITENSLKDKQTNTESEVPKSGQKQELNTRGVEIKDRINDDSKKVEPVGVSHTQQVIQYTEEPKAIKSAPEEVDLSAKYAAIKDIEERAFMILLDLGLVKRTPDIHDPFYDSSADNQLAPGQIFQ